MAANSNRERSSFQVAEQFVRFLVKTEKITKWCIT